MIVPRTLRPYQQAGVEFLREHNAALLADEMGLGKTAQVVSALTAFPRGHRTLLVVPSALVLNWLSELEEWGAQLVVRRIVGTPTERPLLYRLPVDVLVVTYEDLRVDAVAVASVPFNLVVADEAQRIKNLNSSTSFACRLVNRLRTWALTGTPVENRFADLLAIFRFVAPSLRLEHLAAADARAVIRPYVLRRTKREVATELPPILRQDLRLEFGHTQADAYELLWESRAELDRADAKSLLTLYTRLKIACNHDLESGASVKLDALRMILDSTGPTDKVIVFSQYARTLRWLSERLADYPHRLYVGDISRDVRQAAIDWFSATHGRAALLMSLRAGGVGLNLNAATVVVLLDRWWNPAVEEQAIHRAHRLGRTVPLHVVRFLVANTIEERVEELLEHKAALFSDIMGDQLGGPGARLSLADLRAILGLPHDVEGR